MIVASAIGHVSLRDLQSRSKSIAACNVLLLQLEVPCETVLSSIRLARESQTGRILEPAAVIETWTDELLRVDLVCPDESEATAIIGRLVRDFADAEQADASLQVSGAANVVINRGKHGCMLKTQRAAYSISAPTVNVIDTTAAGDAFAGAPAFRWTEADDLVKAAEFAVVASALATTRRRAQSSIFDRVEIENYRSLL